MEARVSRHSRAYYSRHPAVSQAEWGEGSPPGGTGKTAAFNAPLGLVSDPLAVF
jgi:hypothetical protein